MFEETVSERFLQWMFINQMDIVSFSDESKDGAQRAFL